MKLLLRNRQSPGDIVMLTAAVRELHRAYPGRFQTWVQTTCPELWFHNPHLTKFEESEPGVRVVDCQYPLIQQSNRVPKHFLWGFVEHLGAELGVRLEPTEFCGDIHLSDRERRTLPQVAEGCGEDLPYWVIAAGGKHDYTIKWWASERWQAVVDHFKGRVLFVQVGEDKHHHPPLRDVLDLRGKTKLRQLVRLMHHAQGVLCPVTCLMHLAAAVPVRAGRPKHRACVVVAGGREPAHWEAYPHHQFLHTAGALACCERGGCWKSRTLPLGDGDKKDAPGRLCVQPVVARDAREPGPAFTGAMVNARAVAGVPPERVLPRCMDMITTADVIRAVESYFEGGLLRTLDAGQWERAMRVAKGNAQPPAATPPPLNSKTTAPARKPEPATAHTRKACAGAGCC